MPCKGFFLHNMYSFVLTDNHILKYKIPLEVLKELKGAVVQVWISNAIDPVEELGGISHVYVIFVNILKTLKNKNSNFKNIDRRNTI